MDDSIEAVILEWLLQLEAMEVLLAVLSFRERKVVTEQMQTQVEELKTLLKSDARRLRLPLSKQMLT
ncbi:hypothetical protein CEQ06_03290 [Corynebacterium jeikeium]|uniref:hypothetical protein n=1 Tax=Corynebacterium TaxID=1716 RepID=UPI000B519B3E|nr:hypothetical protein [Corynebacterium sp. MSK012]ASE56069.1 hypothetical protein CEQ06_03290 [Corynebacterium jeikeium]MDK8828741.1 hypothetical protein [Corynebacterium sp. MSK012]